MSPLLKKLMRGSDYFTAIYLGIFLAQRKVPSRYQDMTPLFMSTSTLTIDFPYVMSTGGMAISLLLLPKMVLSLRFKPMN